MRQGQSELLPEYFSFNRDLDNLFVESGRQAHVIWRLDGSFGGLRAVSKEIVNPPGGGTEGIWAEPLRLADYVHFHVWDSSAGLTPLERNAKRYTRNLGSSEVFYQFGSHPYLSVLKTVWVPLERPAVIVELDVRNESDGERSVRLFAEYQSHLSIGWPLREGGRNSAGYDAAIPGIVSKDETHPEWAGICTCSHLPAAYHLGDFAPHLIGAGTLPSRAGGTREPGPGRSCMQFDLTLPPEQSLRLAFVVCGSPRSEEEARGIATEVTSRLAELREEKRSHYERLFVDTAVLESPSYVVNKAFLWAKLGTEDFKHLDPRLGYLFFAGYPAYNFYFASDSMLILRGSLAIGDFDDARRMLRTIVRYQATERGRDTLPGEIWHEMSTTGDRISPNFAGFLFPGLMAAFHDWTGDDEFLREMYPHVRALVEWGYGMDTNGDGLLENGPQGEMADSASEDRNVERSHYHVQVQWLDALQEGARLADRVGDSPSATRWRETRQKLTPLVNRFYWNESERYFEETLRPDGCLDTSGKGYANLDAGMVDEGKVFSTTRLLLEEEAYLTDIESFRARKEFEKTFSTHRSYMSWYVMVRGRRALDLYRAHRPEPASRALEDIAASPFHWTTPGLWPEVWAVDEPSTLRARGCFHQAWTGSHGFIYPLVEGMLGLRPDAAHNALALDPHLPAHWPSLRLRKVRMGRGWLDVECEQEAGVRRLTVRNQGADPLTVSFGFALPLWARVLRLTVDGKERELTDLRVEQGPQDQHACVTAAAAPGGASTAELSWDRAPISFDLAPPSPAILEPTKGDGATLLPRAAPGSTVPVRFEVGNHGRRRCRVRLELDTPGGWAVNGKPARSMVIGPEQTRTEEFLVRIPPETAESYYTLRARLVGNPAVPAARTAYLPVFRSLSAAVDARPVARAGMPFTIQVPVVNLSPADKDVEVRVDVPKEWQSAGTGSQRLTLKPGQKAIATLGAVPGGDGDTAVRVVVSAGDPRDQRDQWELSHPVTVLPPNRPLVLFSGFLGCPLPRSETAEVVNLPANYALRRPHVLDQLLPMTTLLLTSDQHDAVLTPQQVASIIRFVREGGRLLFYCCWSAPWGRGFYDTFGSMAQSDLPQTLPLHYRRDILHAAAVRLTQTGERVFSSVPWGTIPAFDYNAADLLPGARLLAATPDGAPLIADWSFGKGRVLAIAIDCFGFESYVEGLSFDFWEGKPRLIADGVRWLLGSE
ncbi:MAG TPA: NEW3 domain-containing protein [Spirochaetia bacterium]|nr:NEW3 domain-containing protein [Spirochaetia bacterium]